MRPPTTKNISLVTGAKRMGRHLSENVPILDSLNTPFHMNSEAGNLLIVLCLLYCKLVVPFQKCWNV